MSTSETTEGFVVRTVDYGDRDVVATWFGRETGLKSSIAHNAKGSKRRFGGGLQPMRRLEITYTPRRQSDLARLESIEILEDYPELEEDFDKIAVGSYATDLVRKIAVEERSDPELFQLVSAFYPRLAEADATPTVLEILLRHFQLRLFEIEGTSPSLGACTRCGRAVTSMAKSYAMRSGEGIVCRSCLHGGDEAGVLFDGALRILHYWQHPDGDPPEELTDDTCWDQARRVVEAALRRVVESLLKSRETLDTVLPTLDSNIDPPVSNP
jgi:DNA repair protein RecO (recombination protein O)